MSVVMVVPRPCAEIAPFVFDRNVELSVRSWKKPWRVSFRSC